MTEFQGWLVIFWLAYIAYQCAGILRELRK